MARSRRPVAPDIRREARAVGLRAGSTPTLEGVERRRLQLWIVGLGLLVAVSMAVALLSTAPDAAPPVPIVLRVAIVALPLAFGAYAIEKEVRLRRLARILGQQQHEMSELSRKHAEAKLLLEAGRAMNSALELPMVLDTILGSAIDLLSGGGGAIMLLETPDEMVTVLRRGDTGRPARIRIGTGIEGRVAESRSALLVEERIHGPDEGTYVGDELRSGVCVALISRGVLFGVLTVEAPVGRSYTDYELQMASLLAEHAAGAISNARRFEAERIRGDRAELAVEFRSLEATRVD